MGCRPNWKKHRIFDGTIKEIRKQLDISTIMQKLMFYDRAMNSLFDENELKLLSIQKKLNLEEIKREREKMMIVEELVQNVVDGESISELKKSQNNSHSIKTST